MLKNNKETETELKNNTNLTFKKLKNEEHFFYFKVTFLLITTGLFAGMLVFGMFDVDFSNKAAILKLILKSLVTAIGIGLIMGFLNMFFKIGNFQKKEN